MAERPNTSKPMTVDEVYAVLTNRVRLGDFPVGSKLPSCRSLAQELGSNPSTVDRAIHQLAQEGVVRTAARRGTFVLSTELPSFSWLDRFTDDFAQLVARARGAGVTRTQLIAVIEAVLASEQREPLVSFYECNERDLNAMSSRVDELTGLTVERRLFPPDGSELGHDCDLLLTPYFHLADLKGRVADFARVLPVNVTAAPHVMLRLAMLDAKDKVLVVAPTNRGVERMSALVRQYFGGPFDTLVFEPGTQLHSDFDVVVTPNATEGLEHIDAELIRIEWDVDSRVATQLAARLSQWDPIGTDASMPTGLTVL